MGASKSKNQPETVDSGRKAEPWARHNTMGWRRTKGVDKPDSLSEKATSALDDFFPGATTGKDVEIHVASQLWKNEFEEADTLFCDSSCPDEINHDDPSEVITMLFQQRWGGIFNLGGLGGLPFAGKTGWNAFSSHVPKDGNIVLLFAPHVGIDSEGTVGKVLRAGQECSSAACGAAIGALGAQGNGVDFSEYKSGVHDFQMDCIKHLLEPHAAEIQQADNQQAALAYKMYEIQEQFIESILHLNWMSGKGKLAIIGGIMINCDGVGTDRFMPLKFEIRTREQTVDLFEDAFGARPIYPFLNRQNVSILEGEASFVEFQSPDVIKQEFDPRTSVDTFGYKPVNPSTRSLDVAASHECVHRSPQSRAQTDVELLEEIVGIRPRNPFLKSIIEEDEYEYKSPMRKTQKDVWMEEVLQTDPATPFADKSKAMLEHAEESFEYKSPIDFKQKVTKDVNARGEETTAIKEPGNPFLDISNQQIDKSDQNSSDDTEQSDERAQWGQMI